MNIFNHIIKDDQITGIGALTWQEKGAGPVYVHYEFDIHTSVGIKTIKSKTCETFGYMEKADQEELKAFRVDYYVVRAKICALIGETDIPSSSMMEELKGSYQQLNQEYLALREELMVATKRNKDRNSIMFRLQNFESSLFNLKTLASA